ncbi:4076_t:CDS:2, partial [Dentiscutata heterogama]
MKNKNHLVSLIKKIIDYQKPDHLARSCIQKCQVGNRCINVRWIDFEINREGIDHVKKKSKISDGIRGTFVKINRKVAEASIRFSSSNDCIDRDFVGYISDIKIDVCSVKKWSVYYTIKSGLKKAIFIKEDQSAKDIKFNVNDNEGEAADSRANKPGNYQHGIKNEKDEQKASSCYDKNERCVKLEGVYVNQPCAIRTINGIFRTRGPVNNPTRLCDLSTSQGIDVQNRCKSTKVKMLNAQKLDGYKNLEQGVGW